MSDLYKSLFEPLEINGLTIRNRFLSTSHAPAYVHGGKITDQYIGYHAEKAKGGIGLTQFGGATAIGHENSFYYGQINGSTDDVIPGYRAMAEAIHAHGAACTVQLTHGGRRERWDLENWLPAFSPSCTRELVHGSFPVEMEDHDIARVIRDYAAAALRVQEGGVDGVEISCQAGTLIEQFWSPAMNLRDDAYGGSLENRMRFGLEVIRAVRKALGADYLLGIRMPGDEMMKGGLGADECRKIAQAYSTTGDIDFISVVGGQGSDKKGEARIWPTMWVPSNAYLGLASDIKREVSVKVFHATRITDAATADFAVREGHIDMVGMTRTMLADPHYVTKLKSGNEHRIRPCVGAGYCVDRAILGLDAYCMHNPATGRERNIPHDIQPSSGTRKKVVVVGGGPGGLEAARISASRGHEVVLFEAAAALGGQLVLAARASWRKGIEAVPKWLSEEIERLGVTVHLNHYAEVADVLTEAPDVVIVATGGVPNPGQFEGSDLAISTWDVLSGDADLKNDVLLFDESGSHSGLSCAEVLAQRGARVQFVTPDHAIGRELGGTNLGAHLTELHTLGVNMSTDQRLVSIRRSGNKLAAEIENIFSESTTTLDVDHVVLELATLPNSDLYFELKVLSRNDGETDLTALAKCEPQLIDKHPERAFFLYRLGDAWASRNVHAAVLDAARLCKDL